MDRIPLCFIVPFFNNEKTVGAVIKSIKDAGYPVLAVSDGSTDSSLEKARQANPIPPAAPAPSSDEKSLPSNSADTFEKLVAADSSREIILSSAPFCLANI